MFDRWTQREAELIAEAEYNFTLNLPITLNPLTQDHRIPFTQARNAQMVKAIRSALLRLQKGNQVFIVAGAQHLIPSSHCNYSNESIKDSAQSLFGPSSLREGLNEILKETSFAIFHGKGFCQKLESLAVKAQRRLNKPYYKHTEL